MAKSITDLPDIFSENRGGKFIFARPLLEAKILGRPNRYIVDLEFPDGSKAEAHCPATGRIGGWELDGLNALVSGPYGGERRTSYTLEVIVVPLTSGGTMNIGINQSAANRYVEASLHSGDFEAAVGSIKELKREVRLKDARIDFNVDNEEFIEVKTPLQSIELDTLVAKKTSGYGSSNNPTSTDRLVKHVRALSSALEDGQKAILLTCFIYDAPTFNPPKVKEYNEITEALAVARRVGLESWQVNYAIDAEGVQMQRLQKLEL